MDERFFVYCSREHGTKLNAFLCIAAVRVLRWTIESGMVVVVLMITASMVDVVFQIDSTTKCLRLRQDIGEELVETGY